VRKSCNNIPRFIEAIGAAGLIVGIWVPQFAALAGTLLAVTMVGALFTHVRIKDPGKNMGAPIVLLVLSLIVTLMNLKSFV